MKKFLLFLFIIVLGFTITGCKDKKDDFVENPDEPEINEPDDNKPVINPETKVMLGIDNIDEHLDLFKGKRVGLITNATGLNSNYESTIDVLYKKVNLTCLFAPEHGIRGSAGAGDHVGNEIDPVTKLPIYSLYGSTQMPTKEMMDKVDIMCIDLQDVGARFYTFIYTMAKAMKACAMYNKQFVVFDRPNPVSGDKVDGNILNMKYSSFVGMYPIVQRHGMTIGELAKYFNKEEKINCDLTVIEMKNWKRNMYFDDCGKLPWVLPSPNMPTLDTAIVYTGTCIFEGTNLSEGRGTTKPFELIGAPFIDSIKWADELNKLNLKGVHFRPASFTPSTSKFSGQTCYGVQLHVTNRDEFESVITGAAMLKTIRKMYPDKVEILNGSSSGCMLNKLTGCDFINKDTYSLDQLRDIYKTDCDYFNRIRSKYLIY